MSHARPHTLSLSYLFAHVYMILLERLSSNNSRDIHHSGKVESSIVSHNFFFSYTSCYYSITHDKGEIQSCCFNHLSDVTKAHR